MTDQAGGTTSQQFLEQVIGSQTIDLPRLPAKVPYGFGPEKLEVAGGASGQQVGLQATPSKVCQLSGLTRGSSSTGNATTSADLVIGGVGTCTVTATQPGTNDYTKAAEVTRTFSVVPAPLRIIPDGASMTFGSPMPKIVVTYSGFVNGNNSNSLSSRPICVATDAGQPVSSTTPPGNYPITCSGAKESNYQLSYGTAQLHVRTTSLTVTANNQTMSYGSAVPTFTATDQGFVNSNTSSVESGLRCSAEQANYLPISSKPAPGTYKITCHGAEVPTGYVVSYVPGTLTVNAGNNF